MSIYIFNFLTADGCDSTITLNLTVSSSYSTTINASICDDENYIISSVNNNRNPPIDHARSIIAYRNIENPVKSTSMAAHPSDPTTESD